MQGEHHRAAKIGKKVSLALPVLQNARQIHDV
jgi:hypothetical protein